MTRKYAALASKSAIPQTSPFDQRQVANNAGGYVYQIDAWARLDRFMILGSDGGSYYQNAQKLTRENAKIVAECWAHDAPRTVAAIVAISKAGRAPRNDAAIFALALGAASDQLAVRRAALGALPDVCRTSTHLFQFINAVKALGRGWGRSLKRAVADWYTTKSSDRLAYQMIKYRGREGVTHKRIMQTAHPSAGDDAARLALYRWARGLEHDADALPELIRAHEAAMKLTGDTKKDRKALVSLITTHKLPWEAVPTEVTKDPEVWAAMLPDMGMTALIRNLGAMTSYGTLKPLGKETAIVAERLADVDELRKARVHPFQVLQALSVYRAGRGVKGSLAWFPVQEVTAALDAAFDKAFTTIVPAGKRFMIGLDVSGSMGTAMIGGSHLSARDGAAAMAMALVRSEPRCHTVAFSDGSQRYRGMMLSGASTVCPFDISPRESLADVIKRVDRMPFGGTDCALPILYAMEKGIEADAFVVLTDSETFFGHVHPMQALREYRRKTGIDAKLITVGMTSTGFTIGDPTDGGTLDVVGFDSNCPALITDFARRS